MRVRASAGARIYIQRAVSIVPLADSFLFLQLLSAACVMENSDEFMLSITFGYDSVNSHCFQTSPHKLGTCTLLCEMGELTRTRVYVCARSHTVIHIVECTSAATADARVFARIHSGARLDSRAVSVAWPTRSFCRIYTHLRMNPQSGVLRTSTGFEQ